MKRFFGLKTARTALLASTLALVAIPAMAQVPAGGSASPGDSSAGYTSGRSDHRDDGTDWGWLGLIGLTGLFGLMPKRRKAEVDYRATDTASRAPAR